MLLYANNLAGGSHHHSLTVRAEDEEWQMDFTRGIDLLTDALELLGIDTSRGLPAPIQPGDEDDR